MSGTLANNITKTEQAPHAYKIYVSDTVGDKGEPISDAYPVGSILVLKPANKIAFAKVVIGDGAVAQQDFTISNTDDFAPGKYITIEMGDANGQLPLFKGVIVKHGIKIKKKKNSVLTIDCRDVASKMTTQCRSKYFVEDTADHDAFTEIIEEYKDGTNQLMDTALEDINVSQENLVQYDCTDWEFILKRANAAGQLVYTNNGTVTTVVPTIKGTADYTVEYGDIIEEFEAEMDARNQYDEINLKVWDSSKQEIIEENLDTLTGIDLDKPGNLSNSDLSDVANSEGLLLDYPGAMIAEEVTNYLKAELIKSKLSRIRGQVSFTSATLVEPRSTIELKGVGDRFNGNTYVTGVRYEFSKSVWTTNLQFGLDRDWQKDTLSKDDGKANRIPQMFGLHIGIVTRLDDESGEDRVKVRIPSIDAESEGAWAKISRPDAGEYRGFFHLPEVDDEVLVGFLNCDPRYPMIMGMLNSSAKPAPVEAKDKENLKGYYSKEGSRLEFDDKLRTIKMQTLSSGESGKLEDFRSGKPELEKNNTILMDDEKGEILIRDKNSNYIKFSSEEIFIEGAKKITLKAPKIMLEAEETLETKADSSIIFSDKETKIQGTPINLNP
ncbi:MAG: type VI secretion system tip protein VgrG [Crocinitomicaceae bacterium]|nr:type VI secretion system tip protein VgrG [Crocinitomicaceae bacterium]